MNERNADAVLAILSAETVDDAACEHVQQTLLQDNHANFCVSTVYRTVEYRGGVFSVKQGRFAKWPRCSDCRTTMENPRIRGEIGLRLCERCYDDAKRKNDQYERQRKRSVKMREGTAAIAARMKERAQRQRRDRPAE